MTKPIFLSPYFVPWRRLIGYIKFWRINIRLDMSVERPANEVDMLLSTPVKMDEKIDICLN